MDSDGEPTDNILFPRNIHVDGIIDSKIVNLKIVSMISRWIDKTDNNSKFSHLREMYLPYKFELLLRGSRDGFTPKIFHTLCDRKSFTVTFVKVKETDEILGGYNPFMWKSTNQWGETKDSFIFSFKNKDNFFKDAILSDVSIIDHAIRYHRACGPCFNTDLYIDSLKETIDYDNMCCIKFSYEKKIRDIDDQFSIEDYEVYQIVKRKV